MDPESSCIFDKTIFFSIICRRCDYKYDGIFKEKKTIEILKNPYLNEVKFSCVSNKCVRRNDKSRI